jgi:hypothetical protein
VPQLRHAMRDTLPSAPSVDDRRTLAERRFHEAETLVAQVNALVQRFNSTYAPLWGTELVLSERALTQRAIS